MADLEKVIKGQRFHPPAEDWNAFIDAAIAHRAGLHDIVAGPGSRTSQPAMVRVRNDADADLDQFAPVILDDLLITFADNETDFRSRPPVFSAVAPAGQNLGNPLAILQEPLVQGVVGRALLAGITPAMVTVSDEDHNYANISAGGLISASSGPLRILWKAQGTGLQWAIVVIGGGGRADGNMFILSDVSNYVGETPVYRVKMAPGIAQVGGRYYVVDDDSEVEPTSQLQYVTVEVEVDADTGIITHTLNLTTNPYTDLSIWHGRIIVGTAQILAGHIALSQLQSELALCNVLGELAVYAPI